MSLERQAALHKRIAQRAANGLTAEERRRINHARAVASLRYPSMISRWDVRREPDAEIVAMRFSEIPEDTRGLTARVMGDPLPGRSALDRERAG